MSDGARFTPPSVDHDAWIDRIGEEPMDVPVRVAELAKSASRLSEQVTRLYDDEATLHGVNWREYTKLLARRVRKQRNEIARLHKQVRELRADVHERDERIAALKAGVA